MPIDRIKPGDSVAYGRRCDAKSVELASSSVAAPMLSLVNLDCAGIGRCVLVGWFIVLGSAAGDNLLPFTACRVVLDRHLHDRARRRSHCLSTALRSAFTLSVLRWALLRQRSLTALKSVRVVDIDLGDDSTKRSVTAGTHRCRHGAACPWHRQNRSADPAKTR